MALGRESLELNFDNSQAVRAATELDAAVLLVAVRLGQVARDVEGRVATAFKSGFASAKSHAVSALSAIASKFEQFGNGVLDKFKNVVGGIFSVFTGNILSTIAGKITSFFTDFSNTILEQTGAAADSQTFLASAIRETGGQLEVATAQAKAFGLAFGTTNSSSTSLFAQARLQLAQAGDPATTDRYLRAFADAAAARGRKTSELPELISGLFTDDATSDKILGQNPSSVYETYAASLGRTAASLSEVEKKHALVNAVIAVGERNTGAATARLNTFSGRLEQIQSLLSDVAAKLGDEGLARNVGLNNLLGSVRDTLVSLVTNESAFDAFIQKVANGLVSVGRAVIDVGTLIAKAFNVAGLINTFQSVVVLSIEAVVGGMLERIGLRARALVDDILIDIVSKVQTALTAGAKNSSVAAAILGFFDFDAAKVKLLETKTDLEKALVSSQAVQDATVSGYVATLSAQTVATAERFKAIDETAARLKQGLQDFAKFDRTKPGGASPVDQLAAQYQYAREQVRQILNGLQQDIRSAFDEIAKVITGNASAGVLGGENKFVKALASFNDGLRDFAQKYGKLAPDFFDTFKRAQTESLDREFGQLRDEGTLKIRELEDLRAKLAGRDRFDNRTDVERLFADATGQTAGISQTAAQNRLIDGALSGKVPTASLSIAQQSVLDELVQRREAEIESQERTARANEDDRKNREAELLKAQKDAAEAQVGFTKAIDGIIATAKAKGISIETVVDALVKLGNPKVEVTQNLKIQSKTDFDLVADDGSAFSRLEGATAS